MKTKPIGKIMKNTGDTFIGDNIVMVRADFQQGMDLIGVLV